MSPVIHTGPICRECVSEGVTPPRPAWRADRCPAHWYSAAYFGRLDPDPVCWPVGDKPWEDAARQELEGLRFFNLEEWTA